MSLLNRLLGILIAARFSVSIDLPVAGLSVELDLDGLTVESAWGRGGGADWLVLDGERRYQVDVVGRTDSDCPLDGSDVRAIDGVDWIVAGAVSCRLVDEARLRVERVGPPVTDEDALLAALGRAFANRRTTSSPPPAPTESVGGPTTLPITGLALSLPGDALWRVSPSGDRDHDGLVRLVPAMPEVQVVVRRHKKAELPSCDAMGRRLLAGGWARLDLDGPPRDVLKIKTLTALAKNRFADFDSVAWCAERAGELLDVRVASSPQSSANSIRSLLEALAEATATRAPLPSLLARRDADEILEVSVLAGGGILIEDHPDAKTSTGAEVDRSPHVAGLSARVAFALRDGLALTARARVGHDGGGLAWGASLEVGASVIMANDLALVLSLGWLEQRDHLLQNRALGLTVELRRGWFAHQGMRWSLLVSGVNLASEVPRIFAAPLEIAWQGELSSSFQLGLSLRTAPADLRGDSDGVELGLRLGWGALWR